MFNDKNLQI